MSGIRGRCLVAEQVHGLGDRPTDVALALAPLAGAHRLSAFSGDWSGTRFLLTADPQCVLDLDDAASFEPIAQLLDAPHSPFPRAAGTPAGAVGGGWVSMLGHALGHLTGRVRTAVPATVGPRLPMAAFAFHDHVLRFDGQDWWAEALDAGDGAALQRAHALAVQAWEVMQRRPDTGSGALAGQEADTAPVLQSVPDASAHMAAVEQVVTAIRAGDIAQANVCARFGLRLGDGAEAAVRAWVSLVNDLHPDRAALVTGPWGALVGASPELYLSSRDGVVHSAPIKGTRPIGDGAALAASTKDSSENVMIVDLVRNDLSRVCEPGSVTVDDLLAVQAHTGVLHLVSRVSGRLVPGIGIGKVLRATFPPASVTGTPKQRATEVTDILEPAARGAHTGAVGFLGPVLADLAVTIRSVEVDPSGLASLGVGGGIVADSTPAEEWHEVLTKAAPLLSALGISPPTPTASTAARKGVADPSLGLIETVLAVDGRAIEIADHVARLRRSVWELTGHTLTADVEQLLLEAATRAGSGAHRLRVRQSLAVGSPQGLPIIETETWQRPIPADQAPGLLLGVVPAPRDGLERHKYADRAWVSGATRDQPAGVDDVAFRSDAGAFLETTRSCLLAMHSTPTGPLLITPPSDGRVLPGVTRQVLIDLARSLGWQVRLDALDDTALDTADGLISCNALRGAQWVSDVGRHHWDRPSASLVLLSHALLTRWRLR